MGPDSNPPLLPFRSLCIFGLSMAPQFIQLNKLGFKVHTRAGIPAGRQQQRSSSGSREAISLEYLRHTGRRSVLHAY